MLQRFCSTLFDLIGLFIMLIVMLFEPVITWLVGSGTPLKTCTLPPLWALIIELSKKYNTMVKRLSGLILLDTASAGPNSYKKIFDRSSGNRPLFNIGLPYQAGALSSPLGQYA